MFSQQTQPQRQPQQQPHATGDSLELVHESSGLRHYLAGRPVHAGSFLRMRIDGTWTGGRYEWSFQEDQLPYLVMDDDRTVAIRADDELRWPE